MRVDPSPVTQPTATASAARPAAQTSQNPFGAVLAQASTSTSGGTAAPAAPAAAPAAPAARSTTSAADRRADAEHQPAATRRPRGERYADVKGHSGYDEIVAGPRNGMFINRSGNERDGMAFVRVQRHGRTFHIYGSGQDRLIVEVRRRPQPVTAAPVAQTPAPQTPAPQTPVAQTPAAQPAVAGGTAATRT